MKFLNALFNIISIINPFRIYNCILCYLATGRACALKISLREVGVSADNSLVIKENKKLTKVEFLFNYLINFVATKYYILKLKSPMFQHQGLGASSFSFTF